MNSDYYSVMIGDLVVAKGMSLGNALILVKALFKEWYEEKELSILIAKEVEDENSN